MNYHATSKNLQLDPAQLWLERRDTSPRRTSRLSGLVEQIDILKSRMNIAVIYGGNKLQPGSVINTIPNTRSWKSYQSVAEDIANTLTRLGFKSVHVIADDMNIGDELQSRDIHFAWLNTGGVQGYNPMAHTVSMLEMFGLPYVGHDPMTTTILDNKHAFKLEVAALGLNTSPFITWHLARGEFDPAKSVTFKKAFKGYDGPFIVKPISGRASLHVHVVDQPSDLPAIVSEVFHATQNQVLIEKYLPGREFCVAVSGLVRSKDHLVTIDDKPLIISPTERVLDKDEQIFTSMDVKPISTDRIVLLPSDVTKDEISRKLADIATTVFEELNLESLVRLDMRMDEDGEIHILEANPKPDLKQPGGGKTSLVCAGLSQIGMDYDDLILSLIADRIDLLFCQKRGTVHKILELLEQNH